MSETGMSIYYERVKKYYESGLWDEARVRKAEEKGWISERERAELLGED